MSKNHCQTVARDYGYKHKDLALLKTCCRDIGSEAVLSDVKTAFMCIPALTLKTWREQILHSRILFLHESCALSPALWIK